LARSYDRHLRRKEAEQKRTLKEQKQALKQVKKSLTTLEKTLPRPFEQNHQKLPVSKPKSADIVLSGKGDFSFEIVGESHYQDNLERICGVRTIEGEDKIVQATLVHDDDNQYDNKAIRVDIDGNTVGYLSRGDARAYREMLEKRGLQGITTICSAKIVGGWDRGRRDKGHYGVKLDLSIFDEDIKKNNELEFYVERLNKESLEECRVGDHVKFWKKPESNQIRIYGSPVADEIGIIPNRYSNQIASHMDKYCEYEAKITEINSDGCKLLCKLYSEEEWKQKIKAQDEVRRKRNGINIGDIYFHADNNFDVKFSDELTLDLKGLTPDTPMPNTLLVLDQNGKVVGQIYDSYYMSIYLKPILKGRPYKISLTSFDEKSHLGRVHINVLKKGYKA
jgi:hypothetical protein